MLRIFTACSSLLLTMNVQKLLDGLNKEVRWISKQAWELRRGKNVDLE